ncbi:MAG: hypothetical protein D6715_14305 [Calditrichaeota bacterium]|nr:MAG: hypothetical protein D6715_14305 [Calditrichota bacterium]
MIFLLSLMLGCTFNEPQLPTWVTEVQVPLEPQKFLVQDQLDSSVVTIQGADSLLALSIEGDIGEVRLEESQLAFPPRDTSRTFTLDTLRFDSLQALNTGFLSLRQVAPQLAAAVGQSVHLPETTFVVGPVVVNSSDFKALLVKEGQIRLSILNAFPFTLGPNNQSSQGLHIALYNDSTGELVSQLSTNQPVQPGETVVLTDQIQQRWVRSPLRVVASLPLAQAVSFAVTDSLLDAAGTSAVLEFPHLLATEALARFHQQHYRRNLRFSLKDQKGNRLKQGEIARGNVLVTFANQFPLSGQFRVHLPEFQQPDGQALQVDLDFLANQTVQAPPVQTNHVQIANRQTPGAFLDSVQATVELITRRTSGFVHLRASDQFQVQVHTDSIFFRSFSGYLAADSIAIPRFQRQASVDYNGLEDGIRFAGAELLVKIFNEVHIDQLRIKRLSITGRHRNSSGQVTASAQVHIADQAILPGDPGNPVLTTISFPTREVTDFLNILPTEIEGVGTIAYQGNASVTVDASRVHGRYSFSTPVQVKIDRQNRIEGDIQTLDESSIDADIREAARDDIRGAQLALQITNHTPFSGTITMLVTTDPARLQGDFYNLSRLDSTREFVEVFQIPSASIDPGSGTVRAAGETISQIGLNRSQIRLFSQPPVYVGFLVTIDPTDGFVTVRGNDFLELAGKTVFQVRVSQ